MRWLVGHRHDNREQTSRGFFGTPGCRDVREELRPPPAPAGVAARSAPAPAGQVGQRSRGRAAEPRSSGIRAPHRRREAACENTAPAGAVLDSARSLGLCSTLQIDLGDPPPGPPNPSVRYRGGVLAAAAAPAAPRAARTRASARANLEQPRRAMSSGPAGQAQPVPRAARRGRRCAACQYLPDIALESVALWQNSCPN